MKRTNARHIQLDAHCTVFSPVVAFYVQNKNQKAQSFCLETAHNQALDPTEIRKGNIRGV